MKSITPRRFKDYVYRRLRLRSYFQSPGDGRPQPQIPAQLLLWSHLVGLLLRESSFPAIEALVCSPARPALVVSRRFGDDALAYFRERLEAGPLRGAGMSVLQQAKRHKAFDSSRFIGLAIDGTGAGRSTSKRCALCHPIKNKQQQVLGHGHHFSLISVVGTGLSLPFDVEPYGPTDSEYAASQRLLQRAIANLGRRFADSGVADGE
jgi:hypothetical protein